MDNINEILLSIENTREIRWISYSEISEKFIQCKNIAKTIDDPALEKIFEIEFIIWDILKPRESIHSNSSKPRFPLALLKYPFNDSDIQYIKKRAYESFNPLLRARYFDILFELNNSSIGKDKKDKYEYGINAAEEYIKLVDLYKNMASIDVSVIIDAIARATHIYLSFNKKAELKEIIILAILTANERKNIYREPGWNKSFVDIAVAVANKNRNLINEKTLGELKGLLNEGKEFFSKYSINHQTGEIREEFNSLVLRGFVDTELDLAEKLKDIEWSQSCRLQAAEVWAEQARRSLKEKDPLVAMYYGSIATEDFQSIGASDKYKEMVKLVENATQIAWTEGHYKRHEFCIPINKISLDQYKNVKDVNIGIQLLINDLRLISNPQEFDKIAEDRFMNSPVHQLVSFLPIGEYGPLPPPKNDDEKILFERNNLLKYIYSIKAVWLDEIVRILQEKNLNSDTIIQYFERWDFWDRKKSDILKIGLERFFVEDYISSLHILVPLFEHTIKFALECAGITSTIAQGSKWQKQTFNQFLERQDVSDFFPEGLLTYFKLIMVEENGKNLRNRIAHGLISKEELSRENCLIVFHQLLLLTSIRY